MKRRLLVFALLVLASAGVYAQQSTGNAGEEADPEMPLRLWTALDRLEGSALMAEYFGPRYPAAYAAIKRSEFEAFMAEVLPREYDWYL